MSIKKLAIICAAIAAIVAVLFLGVLCVFCGFTAPYFDPLVSAKTYDASHAGADHVTVEVRSGTLGGGDVKILRSPNDTIIVKAAISSRTPEYVSTDIIFAESKDDLSLKVLTGSGTDEFFNFRGSRSSIEVYLPENTSCDVSIFTFSGDVYVCPLEGGSLVIEDPPYRQYGRITIDGGNYTAIYVKSDEYMANSGGLVVAKYNSTNAYFETAGPVEIVTLQNEGRLKAMAQSGYIRVTVPKGTGFNINASTGKGTVHCDMPVLIDRSGEGYLKGITADLPCWNLSVDLRTGSGDITVANK